jgi:hypothetical protein
VGGEVAEVPGEAAAGAGVKAQLVGVCARVTE